MTKKENKCNLSDELLLQECKQWIKDLCESGGRKWSLQVPVNFNKDPDMLFIELMNRYKNTQSELIRLKEENSMLVDKLNEIYPR